MNKATEVCIWKQDEDGVYQSGCGDAWVFEDGTPADNHVRFCPFCGLPLVVEYLQ
jgi:hypothetical protein